MSNQKMLLTKVVTYASKDRMKKSTKNFEYFSIHFFQNHVQTALGMGHPGYSKVSIIKARGK